MFDKVRDSFSLLISGLTLFDVMRAGNSGDAATLVTVSRGYTFGVVVAERAAAEVAAASLEREDVLLRVRSSSVSSDDDGHRLGSAGGGDETNGELEIIKNL